MADYYFIAHEMLADIIRQVNQIPGAKQSALQMQYKILEAIRQRDVTQARQYAEDNLSEWSALTQLDENN